MTSVFHADATEQVGQLFDLQLEAGLHHGAQLAVYVDGELVVDLAGGTTGPDGAETTPGQRHVLFSCTKPLAGACLHRLVDEGRLDYDDRVVDHWPQFAEAGTSKAEVTVRDVLSHQAGLPTVPIDAEADRWDDWDAIAASVEDADLAFEPGSTAAYHALSYGWAVGELVRRVSGRPIESYVDEAVFGPLGMDDTSIGLREGDPDDVATLVGFEEFDRCRRPDGGGGGMTNAEAAAQFNEESVRRSVVPAASGIGTARDVARFYACLANGGELDGVGLLSTETVERATSVQAEVERDGTLGSPRRYGLGFVLGGTPWDKFGTLSPDHVFGHGGLGSIVGWGDPEAGIGFAYVTNGIRDEYEHRARVNAMADAVRTAFA